MKNYQPQAMFRYEKQLTGKDAFMHPVEGHDIPDYTGMYYSEETEGGVMLVVQHADPKHSMYMKLPFICDRQTGAIQHCPQEAADMARDLIDSHERRVAIHKTIERWGGNPFGLGHDGACLIVGNAKTYLDGVTGCALHLSIGGMAPVLLAPAVPDRADVLQQYSAAEGLGALKVRHGAAELPASADAMRKALERQESVQAALDALEMGSRNFEVANFRDGSRILMTKTRDGIYEPVAEVPANCHYPIESRWRYLVASLEERMSPDHPRIEELQIIKDDLPSEEYMRAVVNTIIQQCIASGFSFEDQRGLLTLNLRDDNQICGVEIGIDHASREGAGKDPVPVDRILITLNGSDTYNVDFLKVDETGRETVFLAEGHEPKTDVYFDQLGDILNETLNESNYLNYGLN